ncbi:tripartite tricarboxylate transporter substrate binding protein [Prauserella muralis]|nr:tripartite tricarboxylate transporter substrate binding protein [Prauserella muralis]TWE28597.1 tripartite-type tricarboxylate transporter receptor subunit TctC [Prauserella muralis]
MKSDTATRMSRGPKVAITALTACAALTAAACASTTASGGGTAEYPSETVTIVVPYTAGGVSDLTMRALAEFLQKETGQTVLVENREGASGAVAMRYAMNQPADGYTLFNIGQGANVITPIVEDVEYDRHTFTPVANVAAFPSALVVGKDSSARTAEDLFEAARQSPGTVSVATAGATTPGQIAVEQLGTGPKAVPFKPVPFPGNAEALTAVLGGNVDALQINLTNDLLARADKGEIRLLGVGTPDRLPYLPDVPTFAELGFEDAIYSTSPYLVGVRKGTDKAIVDKLAELINKAPQDEQFRETVGDRFVTKGDETVNELVKYLDDTDAAYRPILEGK